MQIDKTTIQDLSIFHHEQEQAICSMLDFTHTNDGRNYLQFVLSNPLDSIKAIHDTQQTIRALSTVTDHWPPSITNGTIMMMEKFFDTAVNTYPHQPSTFSALFYKIFNSHDYSLTRYSIEHFADFFTGLQQIIACIPENLYSNKLSAWLQRIRQLLDKDMIHEIAQCKAEKLSAREVIIYGRFLRHHFKIATQELIELFAKIDAYLSLAIACKKFNLLFPEFEDAEEPFVTAENLFHILLEKPVPYSVDLSHHKNFLFLTGANMAGKSTFIKALGVAVYLAHLGIGVPAKSFRLSFFDGILSNIHVMDNIVKGESYFFNEVQRIKNTIEKISDGKKWLILIDELFKGTNMEDAMKCSTTVIEGLNKSKNALFVLSTHLYEIGGSLQHHDNMIFRYFETSVVKDQLMFSYQLKDGVSSDRLGYLILRREGVVDMLNEIGKK